MQKMFFAPTRAHLFTAEKDEIGLVCLEEKAATAALGGSKVN